MTSSNGCARSARGLRLTAACSTFRRGPARSAGRSQAAQAHASSATAKMNRVGPSSNVIQAHRLEAAPSAQAKWI